MKHIFKGLQIVIGDRRLRPAIWKPLISSAVLFFLVFVAGWFLIVPKISHWGIGMGLHGGVAGLLTSVLYVVLWWFMSGMLYLALAGVMSSLLWDDLSAKIDESQPGRSDKVNLTYLTLAGDAALRLVFSSLICAATLITGCLSFGVLGVLFAGWLGLYDYSACACLRRGIPFSKQFSLVFRCDGWFGFALLSGVISLLPFVNVLAMPALVAGGTLMVSKADLKKRL